MARRNSFDEASAGFRAHLPDLSSPRFTTAAKQSVYEYAKEMQDNRAPPWLYDLTKTWEKLLEEPYTGVTSDGTVREGLFSVKDDGADVERASKQAEKLLGELSEEQRKKISYPINAREWRAWSNPEFLLRPFGLRLEESKHKSILFKLIWHPNPTSFRTNSTVHSQRSRSIALGRRVQKSPLGHARKPLLGRSCQAPQHHEQILLQLPHIWHTFHICHFAMGMAPLRPPSVHIMLLQRAPSNRHPVIHRSRAQHHRCRRVEGHRNLAQRRQPRPEPDAKPPTSATAKSANSQETAGRRHEAGLRQFQQ